jgi:hypothetical protein
MNEKFYLTGLKPLDIIKIVKNLKKGVIKDV